MHIVSYRGPGRAGGVSAALARAWECNLGTGGLWWHLQDATVQVCSGIGSKVKEIAQLPEELVHGHYRYCNDFLWPVMHDLPQYARYIAEDRAAYNAFNQSIGWCLVRNNDEELPNAYFVQDYQLAHMPRFLKSAGFQSLLFWHIPWPKHVDEAHLAPIQDLARGLLGAEAIGFHTNEYAENFIHFVEQHLEEYGCNLENRAIWSTSEIIEATSTVIAAPAKQRAARSITRATKHITRVLTAPLGIDFNHWSDLSARQQNTLWHPTLMRTPFILSVDRADYTKGVVDRLNAIHRFFEKYPDWRGRISFAQICGKTRPGLPAFDQYWDDCQAGYKRLNDDMATDSWQPLLWIESTFSPADLAHAYRTAAGMFVSAVRDGLNLTAKEYVACQDKRPGVLLLSKGTGAWQEIGNHSVPLEPHDVEQMADAIFQTVTMDAHEKSWRMTMLKEAVRENSLSAWWFKFSNLLQERRSPEFWLRQTS